MEPDSYFHRSFQKEVHYEEKDQFEHQHARSSTIARVWYPESMDDYYKYRWNLTLKNYL